MSHTASTNNQALAIIDEAMDELIVIEARLRNLVDKVNRVKEGVTRPREVRRVEEIAQDLCAASEALRYMTVSRGHVLRVKDK